MLVLEQSMFISNEVLATKPLDKRSGISQMTLVEDAEEFLEDCCCLMLADSSAKLANCFLHIHAACRTKTSSMNACGTWPNEFIYLI